MWWFSCIQIVYYDGTSESAFSRILASDNFPAITKNAHRSIWLLKSFGAGLRNIARSLGLWLHLEYNKMWWFWHIQIAYYDDTSESAFFQDFCKRQFPVITKMAHRSFWLPKSFGAGLRIIARYLISAWKKIGAFIRHVPILFKYGPKLPDYHVLELSWAVRPGPFIC